MLPSLQSRSRPNSSHSDRSDPSPPIKPIFKAKSSRRLIQINLTGNDDPYAYNSKNNNSSSHSIAEPNNNNDLLDDHRSRLKNSQEEEEEEAFRRRDLLNIKHPLGWMNHPDTYWSQCVEVIAKRPKGWMQRFANELNENMIYEAKTHQELKEERWKTTGWTKITMAYDSIPKPNANNQRRKENYSKFPDPEIRMKFCSFCSQIVPIGSESIPCERCDLVAHVNCIPDLEKYATKKKTKKMQSSIVEIHRSRNSLLRASNTSYSFLQESLNSPSSTTSNSQHRPSTAPGPLTKTRHGSQTNTSVATAIETAAALATQVQPIERTLINVQDEYVAKDIRWLCHFCQKDVIINKIYAEKKRTVEIHEYYKLVSAIRLQAYFRMIKERLKYLRFRRGIIIFQQVIRMRKFAKLAEVERINQRYVFKIRIHDLKMFCLDPYYQSLLNESSNNNSNIPALSAGGINQSGLTFHQYLVNCNTTILPFPIHRYPFMIGKLNSTKFEKCLSQYLYKLNCLTAAAAAANTDKEKENNPNLLSARRKSSVSSTPVIGTPNRIPSDEDLISENGKEPIEEENLFSFKTPEEEADREIMELLFQGHSLENPQYAKPYREMQILLKGTLFLTVTILEHEIDETSESTAQLQQLFVNATNTQSVINLLEHNLNDAYFQGTALQTYRYDLLMKHSGVSTKLKPSLLHKLGFGKTSPNSVTHSVLNGHSTELDNVTLEKLCRFYSLDTYTTAKPYILVPYSHASVTIKFTLSEVTDWPKAVVIGQSVFHPQHFVIRRKIISVHQSFNSTVKHDELPIPEDGGKINLMLPKGSNYSTVLDEKTKEMEKQKERDRLLAKDQETQRIVKQAKNLLSTTKRKSSTLNSMVKIQSQYPMLTWTLISHTKTEVQDYGHLMILNPVRRNALPIHFHSHFFLGICNFN